MASITSAQPGDTLQFAQTIARALRPGDVVALCGDLGAGKTHFVKGLAVGIGFSGDVTSPTFTLLHEYVGGSMPIYHFDFYRIEDETEAVRLGLDEYIDGDGVCVIEWADKFPALLPAGTRWFDFSITEGDSRLIVERE